jgi:hypothetical protein
MDHTRDNFFLHTLLVALGLVSFMRARKHTWTIVQDWYTASDERRFEESP